jgi:hypothetical protein
LFVELDFGGCLRERYGTLGRRRHTLRGSASGQVSDAMTLNYLAHRNLGLRRSC